MWQERLWKWFAFFWIYCCSTCLPRILILFGSWGIWMLHLSSGTAGVNFQVFTTEFLKCWFYLCNYDQGVGSDMAMLHVAIQGRRMIFSRRRSSLILALHARQRRTLLSRTLGRWRRATLPVTRTPIARNSPFLNDYLSLSESSLWCSNCTRELYQSLKHYLKTSTRYRSFQEDYR